MRHSTRPSALAALASATALVAVLAFLPTLARAQELPRGSLPVWIAIPSLHQSASVVPLGLEVDGALAAPTDPDTVGWYQDGPAVGVPGNAIFDGHVDWAGRLRTFGLLRLLEPGDVVEVTDDQGRLLRYRVAWSLTVDAEDAPLDEIFSQGPAEEITLITCGGAFDRATHQYLSRVVVRAEREVPEDVAQPASAPSDPANAPSDPASAPSDPASAPSDSSSPPVDAIEPASPPPDPIYP